MTLTVVQQIADAKAQLKQLRKQSAELKDHLIDLHAQDLREVSIKLFGVDITIPGTKLWYTDAAGQLLEAETLRPYFNAQSPRLIVDVDTLWISRQYFMTINDIKKHITLR